MGSMGSLVILVIIIAYVNAQDQFLWIAIVTGTVLLLLLYLWLHGTIFTVTFFRADLTDLRGQSADHYSKSHADGLSVSL
jgi:hypothetical protein